MPTVGRDLRAPRQAQNLLSVLSLRSGIERIRLFAMLDTRGAASDRLGSQSLTSHPWPWRVSVHSILRSEPSYWSIHPQDKSIASTNNVRRLRMDQPHLVAGDDLAEALPHSMSGQMTSLQHITRSPWLVDGRAILTRRVWDPCHYLYNADESFGVPS